MKKLWLFVILLGISPLIWAHGVQYEIIKGKGFGLLVKYDSGEPMVDAKVTIYSPENDETPYLKITTDQQGCFLFLPNREGKWAIVVSDNAGHGIRKTIEVKGNSLISVSASPNISFAQKLIMALCVIWGFIGTSLFYLSRRTTGQNL